MKKSINYGKKRFITFSGAILLCILLNSLVAVYSQPQLTYTSIVQNLSTPVNITNAADSSGRLFIVEQGGIVKILKNGVILNKPFLDISSIVNLKYLSGLWSISFPSNYQKKGNFFVLYDRIDPITGLSSEVLARYKVSKTNPDSADINSGVIVYKLSSGGGISNMLFGKDHNLYFSRNDGSSLTTTKLDAQYLNTQNGKIFRIKVNFSKAPPFYSIPPDNPFINTPNALPEIWAFGLRNAFRWSFDRLNGNLWLPDVGGEQWEEVNIREPNQVAGYNYGWPCYEANASLITTDCNLQSAFVFPNFSYPHDSSFGGQCLIGGYVYRGTRYPALYGYYVCSDYESNNGWKILYNGNGGVIAYLQSAIPAGIVSYGEDEKGELYAAGLDGQIYSVGATTMVETTSKSLQAHAKNISDIANVTKIYPTLINNNKFTI